MSNYYYRKKRKINVKFYVRILSSMLFFVGLILTAYTFFPLISWQLYFAPAFASEDIASPIPRTTVLNASTIKSLLSSTDSLLSGIDYTNAKNWFPNFKPEKNKENIDKISSYSLSIPSLGIKNAIVATQDTDLGIHLVNYPGTALPPQKGNAVVFGHSTLPQLFNPSDYKTIFAHLYKLKIGDEIFASLSNITYKYVINSITVVDPSDSSVLFQPSDDSYLTLVTCTPPGTTWKRLILKARLVTI